MHLNKTIVVGVVTSAGPKIRYDEKSNSTCSFWLDVEEAGKDGQTRHSYILVEILGKCAESAAESIGPHGQLFGHVTCPPGPLALKAAEEESARQATHQRTYEQLLQVKPAREHERTPLLEARGCEVIQAAASRGL